MKILFSVLSTFALLTGCVTAPDGTNRLSPEGQIALETSVRIAVRHAVADSPRALEKAQNIRAIVARLQSVVSAESTLAALETVVGEEITKLNLSPVDEADARDLLALFGAALEARLGPQQLQGEGWVRVNDFLVLVLGALPS
jgi:hypothetical protein